MKKLKISSSSTSRPISSSPICDLTCRKSNSRTQWSHQTKVRANWSKVLRRKYLTRGILLLCMPTCWFCTTKIFQSFLPLSIKTWNFSLPWRPKLTPISGHSVLCISTKTPPIIHQNTGRSSNRVLPMKNSKKFSWPTTKFYKSIYFFNSEWWIIWKEKQKSDSSRIGSPRMWWSGLMQSRRTLMQGLPKPCLPIWSSLTQQPKKGFLGFSSTTSS